MFISYFINRVGKGTGSLIYRLMKSIDYTCNFFLPIEVIIILKKDFLNLVATFDCFTLNQLP